MTEYILEGVRHVLITYQFHTVWDGVHTDTVHTRSVSGRSLCNPM